ncbi:mannan endo-1,6-alpha-mannosidase DCW1-like protein [Xylaria sp. CBS 124048]|nr:mannan endo-1,6-alpha-mannosidase DCW1-like protein [Xylaria sp. CBS 124048]
MNGSTPVPSRGASFVAPKNLDINDTGSIRSVASTIAYGTMSYYTGNITNTPETIAIFPPPHYWWQAGACWGAMLDYSHYTGDDSYDGVITQALLSQVGPKFDFMDALYEGSEGNDDQAFWAFSILEAAERNFPQPDDSVPSWLQVAENIWNTMVLRWDETTCGGGLHWQIFAGNPNGLDYKNSVSNGGFFQISARLARATDNATYFEWAEKVWDWSQHIGFIDEYFNVFDGASSKKECVDINPISFSYSQGIYMYGAAVLFNYTNGDKTWGDRTNGLLQASRAFFSPYPNATNIMFERDCEPFGTCDTDMKSFKGYLSRFMGATAQLMRSTHGDVQELLSASAVAAGKACSGGDNETVCGEKWYIGGYDGNPGLGQQMTSLETVQALLAFDAQPPLNADEIKRVKSKDGTTSTIGSSSITSTQSTMTSSPTSSLSLSLSLSLPLSPTTTTSISPTTTSSSATQCAAPAARVIGVVYVLAIVRLVLSNVP